MEMPPLILVSNRGPVRFTDDGEGGTAMLRSSGGLVTALSGLMNVVPAVWISAAIDDADARVQAESGGEYTIPGLGVDTRGRFVVIPSEVYDRYYNVVANPMLWFIQHYLWDLSNVPNIRDEEFAAWDDGYIEANRLFADAVVGALADYPGSVVMLHDYHLYMRPICDPILPPGRKKMPRLLTGTMSAAAACDSRSTQVCQLSMGARLKAMPGTPCSAAHRRAPGRLRRLGVLITSRPPGDICSRRARKQARGSSRCSSTSVSVTRSYGPAGGS